jgi:hypothetical protein
LPCSGTSGEGLRIKLLEDHYSAVNDAGNVKISLKPYQSEILAFGNDLPEPNYREPEYSSSENLNLAWDIELYEMGKGELDGKFKPYATHAALHNITGPGKNAEFSGLMRYRAEFNLDKTDGVLALDLGLASHTVKLTLNGEDCGMAICPPYIFDISGAARKGVNTLEIEAANTLAQTVKDHFSFFIQLPPSGILGPVRLLRGSL